MPSAASSYATCSGKNFRGAFARDFQPDDVVGFVNGIEDLMQQGHSIKADVSTAVACCRYGARDIVIKRYNRKGLLHALGCTLRGSRAPRVWANTLALSAAGIATPAPLAWFEIRRRGLVAAAYLITEFSPAPTLHTLFFKQRTPAHEWRRLVALVHDFIDRLHALGFTHGDVKPTNFLFDGDELAVIDLDAVEVGASPRRFARNRARDRAALARRIDGAYAESAARGDVDSNLGRDGD